MVGFHVYLFPTLSFCLNKRNTKLPKHDDMDYSKYLRISHEASMDMKAAVRNSPAVKDKSTRLGN